MAEIKNNIYYVGAKDWDRKFFDELVPLSEGTTYNAYFIKGSEKNVLIDSVDPEKFDTLLSNLERLGVEKIDYIVSLHCEQDHSGCIPVILQEFPECKVVTNEKNCGLLQEHLHISPEQIQVIEEWETLSLGDKTLQFFFIPWVHWPETMAAYLQEDKVLFPCDMFGSHYATSEMFAKSDAYQLELIKSYYAEIMMPYKKVIVKNLEKIDQLDIDMIAASHGPIYDDPQFPINAYKDWVSDKVTNHVVIPYISMHHSTRIMVEHLIDELTERGIHARPYNLIGCDISQLASSLVDSATVVLAGPQILAGPHPALANAAFLANMLKPKTKFVSIMGSYGWGGKMVEKLKAAIPNIKAELIEPLMIKGMPREDDLQLINEFADKILEKHRSEGLVE
ncbi:FprA family A-type flavoprotein [Sedimentisphaera salicampi]|uniref:FprA family A-type flavoprotein n=1 Tax=Sedimentisphaera salicampi TaxID=1941349 RepID=UPI000B9A6E92|nr:FprA family A-type flavoprotein [Sedimentisphaera salicampi]OXU15067.1 Nitric oxide reductase [Sedimentisphaera salicampi]